MYIKILPSQFNAYYWYSSIENLWYELVWYAITVSEKRILKFSNLLFL